MMMLMVMVMMMMTMMVVVMTIMVQVHGPRLHKPDLSKLQEQLSCLHVYMKSNIKVGWVKFYNNHFNHTITTVMMIMIITTEEPQQKSRDGGDRGADVSLGKMTLQRWWSCFTFHDDDLSRYDHDHCQICPDHLWWWSLSDLSR